MRHPRKGTYKLGADPARAIVSARKKRTRRRYAKALGDVVASMEGAGK